MSTKILCEAVSFGFGPVGKLLAIAQELSKDYELDFIGSGSSLDLAIRSEYFSKIIELDTTSVNSLIPPNVIDAYEVVISVINPIFGEQILRRGKKLIVIDSLFYMWKEIPYAWKNCDLLIIQSFDNEQKRLTQESIKNGQIVGPIISNNSKSNKNKTLDRIIINFGGADYPYSAIDSVIPNFIISLISQLEFATYFKEKIISIGHRHLDRIKHLEKEGYIINTYRHDKFLNLLRNSRLLLTVPGLTTMYESFSNSIPTIFLPPLNYSQFLNLKKLEKSLVAKYSVNWDSVYEIPSSIIEEEEGVRMIESFLLKSLVKKDIQKTFCDNLSTLNNYEAEFSKLSLKQSLFYNSKGGCGTKDAVNQIKKVLAI